MTPEERQLLSGLFDRTRGQSGQTRDREAESFITDAVRQQPYAPYLLAQTVIVQEQALRAASERLEQLEAQVRQTAAGNPPAESSFLGNIGKSLFGGGQPQGQQQAPRQSVPNTGYGQGPQEPYPYNQQQQGGFNQPQQGGPWGGNQGGGMFGGGAPGGGGFLKGALGAAAGVAGGVLLADSVRGLFGGHNNPFGIASGAPGFGSNGETVVNNYYEGSNPGSVGGNDAANATSYDDAQQDFMQDASDDFGNDSSDVGSDGDDSYNV